MNIPVDASQALGSMYRDSFTLGWSLGVAVPLKAGVRVYFPLNKRPASLFTQLRVWTNKQVEQEPQPFSSSDIRKMTVTLVDADGVAFVDNAPLFRFIDSSKSVWSPRRGFIFEPRPLDTRSCYVMWNDNGTPPTSLSVVLGLFYQTP